MSLWQPASRPDVPHDPPGAPTDEIRPPEVPTIDRPAIDRPADESPADESPGDEHGAESPASGGSQVVAPLTDGGLPDMAQLDRFSAELDEIDAALARMDADASLPARPRT